MFLQILKKILQSKYWLFFIFLLIIIFSYYRVNLEKVSAYEGKESAFTLTVVDKKYKDEKYTIIFHGNENLVSYINDFPYDVGDVVKVKGSLIKPINNTIPNTFNYQKYLQSRGIMWELKTDGINVIKKNHCFINKIKNYVTNRINNYKFKEYLYVFVLGDTSHFSQETRKIYQSCGLSYLLSIGSFQVMMLVQLLKCITNKFNIKKGNSLIINIIVILGYIICTGKIIGVLRSGLCYIIANILRYYKIKYKYQNIISLVGIFLLLLNPYYIVNIGFLYSFTISIIISLNKKIIRGNYFKRLLMISVIAFLASMPITIYSNYEINFLAIVFSFIFAPVFSIIIFPLSILVFIFSFLSPLYNFIISFIEYIIRLLSKIDVFAFVFRKPLMTVIIIYYIVIINSLFDKRKMILLLLLVLIHININKIISEKSITFLDVGEGDSIILKNNNNLFLLDTGGSIYNSYYDNIIKYIKSLGMNKIESLILSHGDYDHMGEAINLVNNFKVERVIFNCGEYDDLEKELIEVLNKKKIKYYSCIKELNIDNDKLYFLQTKEYDNENDNSNVIYTELNGYKFMFMGDAGVDKEKDILDKYSISNVDVLKVGHHGSKTSSSKDFIDKINPKYAIISVGRNNRYNHPNKEVLNTLDNSKIYRTNQDGSIIFKIKNNKLNIELYRP